LFSALVDRGEPGKYWGLPRGCFWYLLWDRLDSFAGRFVFLGFSVGLFVIVFVYVTQVPLIGNLICVPVATGTALSGVWSLIMLMYHCGEYGSEINWIRREKYHLIYKDCKG
jgi:vacuolar-type H+-ATPase subunit I/STV1